MVACLSYLSFTCVIFCKMQYRNFSEFWELDEIQYFEYIESRGLPNYPIKFFQTIQISGFNIFLLGSDLYSMPRLKDNIKLRKK